ncbi:MAG: energy transducer TonB [Porphyromonas sp.]|nr:energy transducer TonB [Porphyromonas sp.]
MEIKKSPKADLERGKGQSFAMGLLVALAVLFLALEWGSVQKNGSSESDKLNVEDLEQTLFIPDQEQPEEPEPEAPQEKIEVALPEEFKVVSNDQEVVKISLVSSDQTDALPTAPPPIAISTEEEEAPEDHVFEIVEENPVPPTGDIPSLLKWLGKNIKYPESAANNNIQGKVLLRFVVERDGSVSNVEVVKKVDPALDKEAVRVVKSMDKWKPGKQRGKPVRSRFTLPVQFRLQ